MEKNPLYSFSTSNQVVASRLHETVGKDQRQSKGRGDKVQNVVAQHENTVNSLVAVLID